MRLTYEAKASIKHVRQQKGWGAKHTCKEFPNKNWSVSSLKDLQHEIDKMNSISRKVGSGLSEQHRISSVCRVAELICSQEGSSGRAH